MKVLLLNMSRIAGVIALLASVSAAWAANSVDYPNRPIRMVVPFPPGAGTDTVARVIAKSMADYLKETIVVENKTGAGGTIGATFVAGAKPDGYTILATTQGIHIINPALYPKLNYDPVNSFSPVAQLIASPLVFAVRTESDFNTLKDFVDAAKTHPGELTYATGGQGTSMNAAGELLKHYAGIDVLHVPYRGGGPAMQDFLAGRTTMISSYYSSLMEHAKAGKARLLAVGSQSRLKNAPDLPTVAESGYPDYDYDTWSGLAVPAGTPDEIINKLNEAALHALKVNSDRLESEGYTVLSGTPKSMGDRIDKEFTNITPLLKTLLRPLHEN